MTFQKMIEDITKDMARQAEKLSLINEVHSLFIRKGFTIPEDVRIYLSRYSTGEIYISIAPEYGSKEKDLSPIVHSIARKFHAKFKKTRSYDKQSLMYKSSVEIDKRKFVFEFEDVVPKKCHVEEKVVQLADDEIEQLKVQALAAVKTTRTERIIVCQ